MGPEKAFGSYGVLLRRDDLAAVFVPEAMHVFAVNVPPEVSFAVVEQHILDCVADGDAWAGPAAEVVPAERGAMVPLVVRPGSMDGLAPRSWIGRLTVNISNACNLWCSYCYADHGYYHAPRSFMSAEDAALLVDRVTASYESVNTVQFFGGEPLMNLAAVNAVCERFAEHVERGALRAMPGFSATTNGTLSSEAVLSTLKRWNIELTVSHDGPREIHDANRPSGPDGTGGSSFDRIQRSVTRFREAGIGVDIECTYTARHLRAGVSVLDLMDFFYVWLGQRAFHISPAFLPRPKASARPHPQLVFRDDARTAAEHEFVAPRQLVPLYREAAAATVANFVRQEGPMLSFALEMVKQLIHRRPSAAYCPAFFDQLSIATNGDVYPCFMYIGDPQFRLGNLYNDTFPTTESRAVLARYFAEFGTSPVGTDEWFAPLNAGCVAGEYIATSSLGERFLSELMEAMAEECILGLAALTESAVVGARQ